MDKKLVTERHFVGRERGVRERRIPKVICLYLKRVQEN